MSPRIITKKRLDVLLVEMGLAPSNHEARALIMSGSVKVGNRVVDKPGWLLKESDDIIIKESSPYVGRGGVKLAHALEAFSIDVRDQDVLDVGSSTGGFTSCLLHKGARRVYALDVGYGQLDYTLRTDPRVTVMERVNARYPFSLATVVNLVTVDVSFISLTKVLPQVISHTSPRATVLALVKPQFEAKRKEVGKGGVIRDSQIHATVLARMIVWAIEYGFRLLDLTPSPILGDAGNREFFLMLEVPNLD